MSESLPERAPMIAEAAADARSEHRRAGVRLLRRLVIYHVALAACLMLAAAMFPEFTRQLPIGGISKLEEQANGTQALTGSAETGVAADSTVSVTSTLDRLGAGRQLVYILAGTWLLMLPVSWVHKGIHRSGVHDHSLDETVLILPGIVAGLVLVVQHSLALAFSLAGIVAGVQFRRALQDTFDALFILVAIGTGIAAGIRALEIAAVLTVFFTYATLYVHYFGDGLESDYIAKKKAEKKQRKKSAGDASGDDDDAD